MQLEARTLVIFAVAGEEGNFRSLLALTATVLHWCRYGTTQLVSSTIDSREKSTVEDGA